MELLAGLFFNMEFGLQIYRNMGFGGILSEYDFCMKSKISIFVCIEIGIFDFNLTKIGIFDFIAHYIPVNTVQIP